MQKINGQDMRRHNIQLVIRTILQSGPISRTDLRDKVGLTAASVINITNALLEQNILIQEGLASGGTKGRKALMLNVNPTALYTLGVSVTTHCISIGLANFRSQIVDRRDVQICNTITPEKTVEIIGQVTEEVIQTNHVDRNKLVGMGVAAPGPLDAHTGKITVPPDLPNWRNVPLQKMLRKRLDMPVCIIKESNAAALAEYNPEDGSGGVFFVALFRLGVGGGLVLNGESLLGFHGSAGEVGHIVVEDNGRLCGCGSRGCLEAMISEEALLEEARKKNSGDIDLETLFARSRENDPVCLSIVQQAANYLSKAICNVVHMVSPARIVLGGPLADMCPQLAELVFRQVQAQSYPHDYRDIRMERTSFGEQVFLQGAVSAAAYRLMSEKLENII